MDKFTKKIKIRDLSELRMFYFIPKITLESFLEKKGSLKKELVSVTKRPIR